MKLTHRVPPAPTTSAAVDEEYEAEVQKTLQRADARWRSARKAAERAERKVRRLERQVRTPQIRAKLDVARMRLLRRYDELRTFEELMQEAPGAEATGRGSVHNPLPKGSKL